MLTNIEIETAQNILGQQLSPLADEEIPLLTAFGRVASHDLRVPSPIPYRPQSAMDGFAIHQADLGVSGLLRIQRLKVSDIPHYPLQSGEAVVVNTGFPVPKDTGAVIPHEGVEVQGDYLFTRYDLKPGSNIRPAGEDFQAGELLVASGTRLTPGIISAAAACGLSKISVYRKPRVAVLNLSPYHSSRATNRGSALLPDSNGPLLASLVVRDGGEVEWVADKDDIDLHEIDTLQHTDLLLTTGGTYSREKSEAQTLLEELGTTLLFWGTQIQPGGHNGAGIFDSRLAICLSGNPAACAVGYELLAAPVLRRFQGLNPNLSRLPATCVNDIVITNRSSRRFLRGRAACGSNGWEVEVLPGQKASMIRSLLECNALIEIPGGRSKIPAGSKINIILNGQSWSPE